MYRAVYSLHVFSFSGHPARDFQGYIDKAATNKKIIRDVFREGDMYFRWNIDSFGVKFDFAYLQVWRSPAR